jgi:hypothetical protein
MSTFYQSLAQYKGTVQSIDEAENSFTAKLVNIEEEEDELLAEFSFDDIAYNSEKELIRPGAIFFWLIGQEVECRSVKNISKFIFRRMPVIRGKAVQEAKENARELAKLFTGINAKETTVN